MTIDMDGGPSLPPSHTLTEIEATVALGIDFPDMVGIFFEVENQD